MTGRELYELEQAVETARVRWLNAVEACELMGGRSLWTKRARDACQAEYDALQARLSQALREVQREQERRVNA